MFFRKVLVTGLVAAIMSSSDMSVSEAEKVFRGMYDNNRVVERESDLNLENQVLERIRDYREEGVISSDVRTAWLVYDLTNEQVVVDINGDVPMQAASMIKPLVALAFFHKVEKRELRYGPKSKARMRRMIQGSSNWATNWVLRRIGGPREAQKILNENYRYVFKNTEIVENIPPLGRTYKNKASAHDYRRFLQSLRKRELPRYEEILRLMGSRRGNRLYGAKEIQKDKVLVYNKTGTTAHLYGDMGIVAAEKFPYVFVAIIEKKEKPSGEERWWKLMRGVIRDISGIVYIGMKQKHDLSESIDKEGMKQKYDLP